MKLNLGNQTVTVENRNIQSIISQCLEVKLKEMIVKRAKEMHVEMDNKTLSKVYDKVKKYIEPDLLYSEVDDKITKELYNLEF